MKHPASRFCRAAAHSCAAALLAAVAALLISVPTVEADQGTAEEAKKELIEIMKGVNFVPQLGKDNPICKTFYEDFKQQKNIEHIQPIVKADSYDDPALAPYQAKCPKLDFRLSRWTSGKVDLSHLSREELEELGTPSYGMGHFQLYRLDINNNANDGEEIVFYYEGERAEDRRLPVDGPEIVKEIISPEARAYHVLDLSGCKLAGLVHFNQGGSPITTRNGIIRYKGKNVIYVLRPASYLELNMYSEKLKRIAPSCAYDKPR